MKFYKGDYVKDKIGREGTIIGRDDLDRLRTTLATGIYFDSELTLIRRADEPEWPADVPRCDLPLPKGKTRWAAMGWGYDGEYGMYAVWRRHYKEWNQWPFESTPIGDKEAFYAKAVNDEDYVPPQLSETTNSSQVESKLIATPSVEIERTAKITSPNLSGVEILIQSDGIYVQLDGDCGPFLREEAMTFAELLTAAAKEAQQ